MYGEWNIYNILDELKKLEKYFYICDNEEDKIKIILSINKYLELLKIKKYDLSKLKFNKRINNEYTEKLINNLNENLIVADNQVKNNIRDFKKLINSINKLNIKFNTIYIDYEDLNMPLSIDYICKFLSEFKSDLYEHFNDVFKNNYINFFNKECKDYSGACYYIPSNNKNYINIYSEGNYKIAPSIVHELGHSYENNYLKSNKLWLHNISLYSEVFSNFLCLLFDQYLKDTKCFYQGLIDNNSFITTCYNLSNDLTEYIYSGEYKNIDELYDFIFLLGGNIALAFLEQHNINKKEALKNIDYFLEKNDSDFSNHLLKSVDIDIKKLYSATYLNEYAAKCNKLKGR